MEKCKNCGHEIVWRIVGWLHNSEYWTHPTRGCTDFKSKNVDCSCTNPEPEFKQDEQDRMTQRNMLFGQEEAEAMPR